MAVAGALSGSDADPTKSTAGIADDLLRDKYFSRIGLSAGAAEIVRATSPGLDPLRTLLTAHIRTVPFENLDQHSHPVGARSPAVARRDDSPTLPSACRTGDTPTVDVARTLDKRRGAGGGTGGLINFAFKWLLLQLGFSVRLCLADDELLVDPASR
eukprot:gene52043-66236_t